MNGNISVIPRSRQSAILLRISFALSALDIERPSDVPRQLDFGRMRDIGDWTLVECAARRLSGRDSAAVQPAGNGGALATRWFRHARLAER